MPHTNIDLHFSDAFGRDHLVQATACDGSGWRVSASLDGCTFTKQCSRWQSVERMVVLLRYRADRPPQGDVPSLRHITAAAVFLIAALFAATAYAQPLAPETPAVQTFTAATRGYVEMHRRLESQVGVIHLNITVAELNRIIQELAVAIRAERPDAKQGDFFTPALAPELRARIDHALAKNGFTADDVREKERRDAIDAGAAVLRVNGTFPWALGTAMFPCVIAALPPLPPELQYRIVGDALVLIDVHASLIVDLLPHALVETTERWGTNPRPVENPAASDAGTASNVTEFGN